MSRSSHRGRAEVVLGVAVGKVTSCPGFIRFSYTAPLAIRTKEYHNEMKLAILMVETANEYKRTVGVIAQAGDLPIVSAPAHRNPSL